MLDSAVVLLRLAQYTGATILFGSSLFLVYALPDAGAGSGAQLGWPRRLLAWGAAGLLLATGLGLLAHTAVLAGSIREGLQPASISAVITTMSMGPSSLVRAGAAAMALAVLALTRPSRTLWRICAGLGAVVCASFAWMGHGAATEGIAGLVHLAADILHALAAGAWVGALAIFVGLLRRAADDLNLDRVLHKALHRFSGVGSALVATLVATGLVNSWFLVGPTRLSGLWTTAYGQLLSLKLALFAGMLALAAANRFRLTPALGLALDGAQSPGPALQALRRSLVWESALALAVLGLVAWLGTLAPVSAQ